MKANTSYREMTYTSSIRETLKEEMRRDQRIVVIGEDVGIYGGIFQVTRGLIDEFGKERVIDTPISENGIVGVATGLAMKGLRSVAEIMYMDFLQLGVEELVTEAARARFLSGGRLRVPMVVRTQYNLGRPGGYGPQHTQFFASWFYQAPGLYVLAPSTPADAKGLLSAALRSDDPCLFIESSALYPTKGMVPEGEYVVDIGTADVKRQGRDVTIVAISRTVPEALTAAEELSRIGIDAEVVDPRTLNPLDTQTIVSSVQKTKRLLVASDDFAVGGVGAAIESAVLKDIFFHLEAPIEILGPPFSPAPGNAALEPQYLVSSDSIVKATKSFVTG